MSTTKPSDVFSGDVVRLKYRDAVKSLLDKHCTSKDDRLVGTMLTNKFATSWQLPGGTATWMPSFWGAPGSFSVRSEAARAWVLQLLGADLSRSRTYSKYLISARKAAATAQWIVGERFLGLEKCHEYKVFTVLQLTKSSETWQIASEPFYRRAAAVAKRNGLEAEQAAIARGEVVLMSWHDSNMAGDDWTWQIILARQSDNTWSLTAKQEATPSFDEGDEELKWEIDGGGGIRTGVDLKEAIVGLFTNTALGADEPDWEGILAKTKRVDRGLAAHLQAALAEGDGDDDSESD